MGGDPTSLLPRNEAEGGPDVTVIIQCHQDHPRHLPALDTNIAKSIQHETATKIRNVEGFTLIAVKATALIRDGGKRTRNTEKEANQKRGAKRRSHLKEKDGKNQDIQMTLPPRLQMVRMGQM